MHVAISAFIGANHESGADCLPDLLAAQVQIQPDATALIDGTRRMSFAELATAASRLAAHLRDLGVSGDTCVGMFVEPSLDLMIGAWGILLAGGAYLPLSPEYPEDRLRYMIEDSRTKIVFTQDALVARL